MHALVTGGAGFIGSHLSARLLDLGHDVTCVDNLERSIPPAKRRGLSFLRHDVTQPLQLAQDVDVVYHLACPAGPANACEGNPLRTLHVAIDGTLRVLEFAAAKGARFILASTSEIYGDPLVHPQPESYTGNVDTQHPRAVYSEGKRVAEVLTAHFVRAGADAVIARFFNVYGPGMPDDGCAIPTFVDRASRNELLPIWGSGKNTRCFCYVSDAVDALVKLSDRRAGGGIFNIGNPGEEVSVIELAERVILACESASGIRLQAPGPVQRGEPRRRLPDITRASYELDWRPTVSLGVGLRRTAAAWQAAA